jgi:hypothetical protein
MRLAIGILSNTPIWVYALFAYVIWQGWAGMRQRARPLWRMLIVPFMFLLLGVWRLALTPNLGWQPLSAWFAAALVFGSLAFARGPRLLAVDRDNGLVTRASSVIPLIRNITVFLLQYGLAVAAALHLDTHGSGAIVSRAVSGATAGYFIGWSIALLRSYWSEPATRAA